MFPFECRREDAPWFALFAAVALLECVLVAAAMWTLSGGHFMLPLDDSYIHLQYARQLARGGVLAYTEGMLPSGGATSPLYVALLSPLFAVGLSGVKGAAAAFAFGALLWMLLPIWVYQLVTRLSDCLAGAVAAGLVLANGFLLWHFLSGMETALFTTLLVGVVLAAQTWWRGERPHARHLLVVMLAALPLVRPEGVLAPVLMIVIVLARRGAQPRLHVLLMLATLLPFLGWLILLKGATGDWRPSGLTVKGLSAYPYYCLMEKAAFAAESLAALATRYPLNAIPDAEYAAFKGVSWLPYHPFGLALLAAFGFGSLLLTEARARLLGGGALLVILTLLGFLSVTASLYPFVHQQRYLAPWTALALVIAVVAARRAMMGWEQQGEPGFKALAAGLLILSVPSVPFWMKEYGHNSRDIFHVLRRATFPLEAGPRVPLAVTDAGVLAYYTDRPCWDLVGLTSVEFTAALPHGEGAILEVLAGLPLNRRPAELLTYREWFSEDFPLGTEKWSVGVPRTTITSGSVLGAYPIDWSAIDRGSRVPPGISGVILEVDVADLESEAASGYEFKLGLFDGDHRAWPRAVCPTGAFDLVTVVETSSGPTTATLPLRRHLAAAEGGRAVRGESFTVAAESVARAGVVLTMRVGPSLLAAMPEELVISATSNTTGYRAVRRVSVGGAADGVELVTVDLAGMLEEAGGTQWRISIAPSAAEGGWASYHHWIHAP